MSVAQKETRRLDTSEKPENHEKAVQDRDGMITSNHFDLGDSQSPVSVLGWSLALGAGLVLWAVLFLVLG